MDIEKLLKKRLFLFFNYYGEPLAEKNVLFAVSGGLDSLVLSRLLRNHLISDKVFFYHLYPPVSNSDNKVEKIKEQMEKWGWVNFIAEPYQKWNKDNSCYQCARTRRHQIFEKAKELGIKHIIMGHTGEDAVEVYLMNLLISGNPETIKPVQEFFGEYLLLRPLIFALKKEIKYYGKIYHIEPVSYPCKGGKINKREKVREFLQEFSLDSSKVILRYLRENYF